MMSPVGRLVMLRAVSKTEPGQGDGLADDSRHDRAYRRSAGWRVYRHLPVVALDLLHQRTHRHRRYPPGTRYIEDIKEPTRTPFDLRGLLLAGTALASLMFGIEVGEPGRGVERGRAGAVRSGCGRGRALCAACAPPSAADAGFSYAAHSAYSVICGSLSRIAVGAMPFLLPMMFQLGFGLSAARAGGHLCQFGRLDSDAAYRAAFLAPSWLSQRVHLGRADRHAVPCIDRCIPAELADRGDLCRAVAERVFPVAAIHGL